MRYSILLLLLFSGFFTKQAAAQSDSCTKPLVKANRNRNIEIGTVTYISETYADYQGNTIRQNWVGANGERLTESKVTVTKNDRSFEFNVRNDKVTGSYIRYISGDTVYTDTLDTSGSYATHFYFNRFSSNRVRCQVREVDGGIVYYRFVGSDSFRRQPLQDGSYEDIYYGFYNRDSVHSRYSAGGELLWQKTDAGLAAYRSGRIERFSYDTVMQKRLVHGVAEYGADGLPTIASFYGPDSIPCCTWIYYNASGKIVRKVNHKPVTAFPEQIPTEPVPEPERIFTTVEQMPEYAGGFTAFRKYLTGALQEIVCSSRKPLVGSYYLTFVIRDSGFVVEKLEGNNADAIDALCKSSIHYPCKPGKINGRPTISEQRLRFEIKPGS